jgi:anti-sigma factor RsiW
MPADHEGLDDERGEFGQALRERLPRHPAPARLRSSLARSLAAAPGRRAGTPLWLAPATSALAGALVAVLWLAPSLPTTAPPDPLRPLARAVMNEYARTVLWGQARPDVLPTVLPWAMDESGVGLSWVFLGDERIQLVNVQPTYLEGRRGIELAYQDADGHAVSYLIVPAPTLVLPERGRVQIDRWRPLVRTENGFSMILWKQQGLLCALISDLVSDGDLGKLKDYFIKVRSSTEPFPHS